MSSEFGNWSELARLWHRHTEEVSTSQVERHARRQRQQMLFLAGAEVTCMSLSFIAAVWIAVQTAMVAMTAITAVFFALCAFLQHRMRRELPPSGGHDLLSSLQHSIAREEWNLAQLGIGRAITFLTLFGIVMVASDHLLHVTSTPAARLWALLAVAFIVMTILGLNLVLTRGARVRKARMESFALRLSNGPEFGNGGNP
jgi:FtsH-binding integral membrane protein